MSGYVRITAQFYSILIHKAHHGENTGTITWKCEPNSQSASCESCIRTNTAPLGQTQSTQVDPLRDPSDSSASAVKSQDWGMKNDALVLTQKSPFWGPEFPELPEFDLWVPLFWLIARRQGTMSWLSWRCVPWLNRETCDFQQTLWRRMWSRVKARKSKE